MIQFICGSLIGIGIFCIVCDLLKLPDQKVKRAFVSTAKRQSKQTSKINLWLQSASTALSKHLRLNEYNREKLVSDLQTANINITPEQHIANAIIKGCICALLAVPMYFIFPILSPVILILAGFIYAKESIGMKSKIKKHRAEIEFELPRFVFFVEKTLMHNRDILTMIESYKENAGEVFKRELDITASDMRSGNYEMALVRLESRVGSSLLSDVVRGLISTMQGEKTEFIWYGLSVKFAELNRNRLKAEANKVPNKVRKLSMFLLFCFMLIYIVVIVSEIMTSMGVMFG